MRQQIIVSGLGGQGTLTLTRILAETAAAAGHEVITSETHGMAQRGGSVVSMVKVGPFRGPLIAPGEADLGLFLHAGNLAVHGRYMRPGAPAALNTPRPAGPMEVDATGAAAALGSPVSANLVLLGFAAGRGLLFAGAPLLEEVLRRTSPPRHLEAGLGAFRAGLALAGGAKE